MTTKDASLGQNDTHKIIVLDLEIKSYYKKV